MVGELPNCSVAVDCLPIQDRSSETRLSSLGRIVGNLDTCRFYVQVDWICKHWPTYRDLSPMNLAASLEFFSNFSVLHPDGRMFAGTFTSGKSSKFRSCDLSAGC
jgi:hypothetical protein